MLNSLLNFEKAIPFLKIKYFGEKHGPFKILKILKILKFLKILKILKGRSLAFKILRILKAFKI